MDFLVWVRKTRGTLCTTTVYCPTLYGSKVCPLYCKVMFTFAAMPDLRSKMSALTSNRQTTAIHELDIGVQIGYKSEERRFFKEEICFRGRSHST